MDLSASLSRPAELLFVVVVLAAAIVFLVSALLVAFRAKPSRVEIAPVRKPEREERQEPLLEATGYVIPRRRATVAAKIAGRIKELSVERGEQVAEGQVLATLDDSDARVRLASVLADLDAMPLTLAELHMSLSKARRECWRTRAAVGEGSATQDAFQVAQAALQSLQLQIALAEKQVQAVEARVHAAQQEIEDCVVRSPFGGVVLSQEAQPGEMVSPVWVGGPTRSGIVTIVDTRSLEVEADIDESQVERVKQGQAAVVLLKAYPERQIPARVRTVIPTADREHGTVKVLLALEKLDPRMLPNMRAKVVFLKEEAPLNQARL